MPFPPAVLRIFERFERIEPIIAHRRPKHLSMMHLTPLLSTPPPLPKEVGDDQAHARRRARSFSRKKVSKPVQASGPSPPSTPQSPEPCQDAPRPPAGQKPALRKAMPPPPWLTPHWDPLFGDGFLPVPPLAASLAGGVYGAPVVPGLGVPSSSRRFRRKCQRSASPSGQRGAQERSPARSPSPPFSAQKLTDGKSPGTSVDKHRPNKAQKAVRVASTTTGSSQAATTARTSPKLVCRAPRQLVHLVVRRVFQRVAERTDNLSVQPAAATAVEGVLQPAGSQLHRAPFARLPSVGTWLAPVSSRSARRCGQLAALNQPEEEVEALKDYAIDVTTAVFDPWLWDQTETSDLVTVDLDFES